MTANIPADRIRADELRNHLQIGDRNVILFCGTLIPAKRVDRLLQALSEMTPDSPDPVLLVVGDGPAKSELEEMAKAKDLQDRVFFTGAVWDGTGAYFELADFFVLPGLGGLAIGEAMCHGIPVISAPADGTERDYIQHGQTGYLLQNGPEEQVTKQLRKFMEVLLKNPDRTRQMGGAAREFVETEANVQKYMSDVLCCLVDTLDRPVRW